MKEEFIEVLNTIELVLEDEHTAVADKIDNALEYINSIRKRFLQD